MSLTNAQRVAKLESIRDSLIKQVDTEILDRETKGIIKTNYSIDGQGVQWDDWLANMMKRIDELHEQIVKQSWSGGPVTSYMRP